jgi:hypothetical protein
MGEGEDVEKSNWGFNSITYCSSPQAPNKSHLSPWLVACKLLMWLHFLGAIHHIFFTLSWWPIAFVGHFQELLWPLTKLWRLRWLHFPWYLEKNWIWYMMMINDNLIVVKFELLGIPHLLAIFVSFCLGE